MSYYNTDALYGGWDVNNPPRPNEQYIRYLWRVAQRVSTLRDIPPDLFYNIFLVQWHMDSAVAKGETKKQAKEGIARPAAIIKAKTAEWALNAGKKHPEMAYALARAVISRNVRSGRPGTETYSKYVRGVRAHRRAFRRDMLTRTPAMRQYMSKPDVPYFGYAGNSDWPYDIRYAGIQKRELTKAEKAALSERLHSGTGRTRALRAERERFYTDAWNAAADDVGMPAAPPTAMTDGSPYNTRSRGPIPDMPAAVRSGMAAGQAAVSGLPFY